VVRGKPVTDEELVGKEMLAILDGRTNPKE
jgi:hypothetical protein